MEEETYFFKKSEHKELFKIRNKNTVGWAEDNLRKRHKIERKAGKKERLRKRERK